MKYIDFFAINPEYFPQVNEKLMIERPDHWKTFYPHDSFLKLLKDTIDVISGKQKVSLWVYGAYGTGKSHAVLTLKKLLEATENDTKDYFNKFSKVLTNDIFNQFQQIKTDSKKILTVHRYGSSGINSDSELFFAIQESIIKSLEENGYKVPSNSLKNAILDKLSNPLYKDLFDGLLKSKYRTTFSGNTADEVIEKLNIYTDSSLASLMGKIMDLGKRENIPFFTLTQDYICDWIEEVIKENNLKAIVFIWDEFSEFFTNNRFGLTGFQKIADLSSTTPFYFLLVTHSLGDLQKYIDSMSVKKLLDRFNTCRIELPDNIAFKLIANALEKNPRKAVEWKEDIAYDLQSRTDKIRKPFEQALDLIDEDFYDILPIHPYTALVLKHISSAFDSNQRSMFDFIKNDRGEELRGFIWFIKNCGPYDDNPFLTIDMIWEFFYEKQKDKLLQDTRQILDCYNLARDKRLGEDEKRVFKTVLLLQAVFEGTGKSFSLFRPTENNINNAFIGTDLDNSKAVQIAHRLTTTDYMLLYNPVTKDDEVQFEAYVNKAVDYEEIKTETEEREKNTRTANLITEGKFESTFNFSGFLRNRILPYYVAGDDFKYNFKKVKEEPAFEKIKVIFTFSKNEDEAKKLKQAINETVSADDYFDSEIIIIDSSENPLGDSDFKKFAEFKTSANKYKQTKKTEAESYEKSAKEILDKWQDRISNGRFKIYTNANTFGESIISFDNVRETLAGIDKDKYPYSIEAMGKTTDNMWVSNSSKQGAKCGIQRVTAGAYKSGNPNTKLENMLKEAWTEDEYWKKYPNLIISKIKKQVIEIADSALKSSGKVSLNTIYDELSREPFGFMPVNVTAFILGFVLREYVNDKNMVSDGLQSDKLTEDKLAEIIEELIKSKSGNVTKYREKFISETTLEQAEFYKVSAKIFGLSPTDFTDIDRATDLIRNKMKSFPYPIIFAKYNIKNVSIVSKKENLEKFIELFTLFVKENDKENIAGEIGLLSLKNIDLFNDSQKLITKDSIRDGMLEYISKEKKELVDLANTIGGTKNRFLEVLKDKISKTSESKWLWEKETVDKKIDEIILEYKIIKETNRLLGTTFFIFENAIKEWKADCKNIKISLDYAKDRMGDEKHKGVISFLEFLNKLCGMVWPQESQKIEFVDILQKYGDDFSGFMKNQKDEFLSICSNILDELFDKDRKDDVFERIRQNDNLFLLKKERYEHLVNDEVESINRESENETLRNHLDGLISDWKTETGTESPLAWSEQYCMPIKYMIPDDYDLAKAEKYFKVLNEKKIDKDLQTEVQEIFADFIAEGIFDRLNDEELRDNIFREKFIKKENEKIFDNIGEVKSVLSNNMQGAVYNWTVDKAERYIKELANKKYSSGKYNIAFDKVDKMDSDEAKRILKNLIKDMPSVGMEIINRY